MFRRSNSDAKSRSRILMYDSSGSGVGPNRFRECGVFLKHGVWWLDPSSLDKEHNRMTPLPTNRMARSPVELIKALEQQGAGQLMEVTWAPLDDEVAAWVHMTDELGPEDSGTQSFSRDGGNANFVGSTEMSFAPGDGAVD